MGQLRDDRLSFSAARLDTIRKAVATWPERDALGKFTAFAAGSYGRLEASEWSDLDVFFVFSNRRLSQKVKQAEASFYERLKQLIAGLEMPEFSGNGKYLTSSKSYDIAVHLGSAKDDYFNHLTTRLLLLLESRCLFNDEIYAELMDRMCATYFRDYTRHSETFRPWFLINDIHRYWLTLGMNYENQRNLTRGKVQASVKNFKLKFSRLTTCYATIACLFPPDGTAVDEEYVRLLANEPPLERLMRLQGWSVKVAEIVDHLLEEYEWFMTMTALTKEELEKHFQEKSDRELLFKRAEKYSDLMFSMLGTLDSEFPDKRILRSLAV